MITLYPMDRVERRWAERMNSASADPWLMPDRQDGDGTRSRMLGKGSTRCRN